MFNFTTTTVINSLKDSTGAPLLKAIGDDALLVKGVNTFKKDNVSAIYMAEAVDPENEELTITLTDDMCKAKAHYRISIYVGLTQASSDSRYSNDMIYKGKLFSVEYIGLGTPAKTAEKIKKTVLKYSLLVYGEKLLDVDVSGDTDITGIVIKAKTEYLRFKSAKIEEYNPDNTKYPYSGQFDTVWDLEDNKDAITKKGVEGFGTYDYILHNLRLPTFENTYAFGINQAEMPIIGAKYTQFTIKYCVDRGPLGLNGVGDQVRSVTTHVFFVNSNVVDDFKKSLAEIAPEEGIEEVAPKVN